MQRGGAFVEETILHFPRTLDVLASIPIAKCDAWSHSSRRRLDGKGTKMTTSAEADGRVKIECLVAELLRRSLQDLVNADRATVRAQAARHRESDESGPESNDGTHAGQDTGPEMGC